MLEDPDTTGIDVWEALRRKDAQILQLQQKLAHHRRWLGSVHARVQQSDPQALKNVRRLYIGGVPEDESEDELRGFFNSLMMQSGALVSPGPALTSCKITRDKSYAFIELRSVEETSNATAFDGVAYKDSCLKIRRPSNFCVASALMLGPMLPDPTMDTSLLGLCKTVVEDSPNKIFVGGLPCDWNEDQVKELLLPYGSLNSFNLVMDKVTGKSKGYSFCEYNSEGAIEEMVRSLHGRRLASKNLTVRRAMEGAVGRIPGPGSSSVGGYSHSNSGNNMGAEHNMSPGPGIWSGPSYAGSVGVGGGGSVSGLSGEQALLWSMNNMSRSQGMAEAPMGSAGSGGSGMGRMGGGSMGMGYDDAVSGFSQGAGGSSSGRMPSFLTHRSASEVLSCTASYETGLAQALLNGTTLLPSSTPSMGLGAFSAASTLGAFASSGSQSLVYSRLAPSISAISQGQYGSSRGLPMTASMQQGMSLQLSSAASAGQLSPIQLQQHHSAPVFRQLLGSHGSHGNMTGADLGW
ncbi:MAG: hypothetical protein WDW36_002070 [Sanguina aurantia]